MAWKKSALIVPLLALGAGVSYDHFSGQRGSAQASPVVADASVPVKVALATRSDIDLSLKVIARTEAWSSVTVRARSSGQLEGLGFSPGAKVRKGELLAQLDPLPFKAQLDQARGEVSSAQAKLAKAQADFQRYSQVLAKGFVSRADFDSYKANVEVARASLQTSVAAQQLAQLQFNYARIVAPFDGVTGTPLAWPGAQVIASSTDIVVLNQVEPIRVTFSIPEDSLGAVHEAQARGNVKIQAQLPGGHGEPLQGVLDFVDNTVDTTTSTIIVKGRFENTDDRLTPGQFLEVRLPTARFASTLNVPAAALQSSDKGDFVFVIGTDRKAHQRYVSTGPTSAGRIVIDKGLQAGEQVVTDGQLLLTEGTLVHVETGA